MSEDKSGRIWASAIARVARAARLKAGKNRSELARLMRGSRDQVVRVESESFQSRLHIVAEYAHALDMSLWELIEEAERVVLAEREQSDAAE